MKSKKRGNKFQPEPTKKELEMLKTKDRVKYWKLELLSGFIFISVLMKYYFTAEGWKAYLSGLAALVIFYFFISAILDLIVINVEIRDKNIFNLIPRFTSFICDASLGLVEEKDLIRLARAADIKFYSTKDDLSIDDFSLINRTWLFWKSGFEMQDETECVNCGKERKEHSRDGTCPSQ